MAYQYVSAMGRLRERPSRWGTVNVSGLSLMEIYRLYDRVIIELSNSLIVGHVYFDLLNHRPNTNPTLTLAQWLVANGNSTLVTKTAPATATFKSAVYRDALLANYSMTRVAPTGHPTSNSPDGDKTDVLLTRDLCDYIDFGEHVLVTVNGMIHRSEGSAYGVYVRDAWRSAHVSQATHMGVLSFKNITNFTIVPITPEMVISADGNPLAKKAYIKLPANIGARTPILVLGGYLHADDGSYQIVGDAAIMIDTSRLSIPERIWNSRRRMYLGNVLDPFINDSQTVSTDDLLSDELMTRYLSLSQSFVVLLETNEGLVTNTVAVENCELPGRYITTKHPVQPLIDEQGRLLPYWPTKHFDRYILSVDDSQRVNYRFNTTNWQQSDITEGVIETGHPTDYTNAAFLEIGIETIQF